MEKKNLIIGGILILIIAFVAIFATNIIVQDTTQRITESITNEEIERTTEERTNEILGELNIEQEDCDIIPRQREFNQEPYYTGPLIDAHIHMPVASRIVSTVSESSGYQEIPHSGEVSQSHIDCLLQNEGATKAFGFYLMPNLVLGRSIDLAKNTPATIIPFYMPVPINSLNPSTDSAGKTLDENPGFFKGLGEISLEQADFWDLNPESPLLIEYYELARKHNLVVMLHPRPEHKNQLESVLQTYPEVMFLVHSGNIKPWISEVVSKHENIVYSLDANLAEIHGWEPQHDEVIPTKEEFLTHFRNNFDSLLQQKITQWKPIIEENPDKYAWATDRWHTWNFDPEVSALLEEFGRSFIGQLSPETQAKFAYQNAEKLLA